MDIVDEEEEAQGPADLFFDILKARGPAVLLFNVCSYFRKLCGSRVCQTAQGSSDKLTLT